jgi:hypothetical protein
MEHFRKGKSFTGLIDFGKPFIDNDEEETHSKRKQSFTFVEPEEQSEEIKHESKPFILKFPPSQ